MPTDARFEHMSEFSCADCATSVLVRKASPEQTSIQWGVESRSACAEFGDLTEDQFRRVSPFGCAALKESIHASFLAGNIPLAP